MFIEPDLGTGADVRFSLAQCHLQRRQTEFQDVAHRCALRAHFRDRCKPIRHPRPNIARHRIGERVGDTHVRWREIFRGNADAQPGDRLGNYPHVHRNRRGGSLREIGVPRDKFVSFIKISAEPFQVNADGELLEERLAVREYQRLLLIDIRILSQYADMRADGTENANRNNAAQRVIGDEPVEPLLARYAGVDCINVAQSGGVVVCGVAIVSECDEGTAESQRTRPHANVVKRSKGGNCKENKCDKQHKHAEFR